MLVKVRLLLRHPWLHSTLPTLVSANNAFTIETRVRPSIDARTCSCLSRRGSGTDALNQSAHENAYQSAQRSGRSAANPRRRYCDQWERSIPKARANGVARRDGDVSLHINTGT
ncbi:hypothetical protein E2C01_014971 [Portunus trituberculatus]|uniref:Uncharacterized protein n=1 Tax=Portunus trituberculatus TaxID=210409 RepID=A0A5B7DLG4_PORTR|nr:hypothetical protein [Portunus trituberculatus]